MLFFVNRMEQKYLTYVQPLWTFFQIYALPIPYTVMIIDLKLTSCFTVT